MGDHREGQGAANGSSLLDSDVFSTAHREGQGAANGASLLDCDGFCTAVGVSLILYHREGQGAANGSSLLDSDVFSTAHREGQGAANGASLLDCDGFCTAVGLSLMEEEKTQAEKQNEERLVKEHIQKNDHIYSGVFDPPRDGNCLMAVANHGAIEGGRISRDVIVEAVPDLMRSGGADDETIAVYQRNMLKSGTMMEEDEIQIVANLTNSVITVTSIICIIGCSDSGEKLNDVVFCPKNVVNSQKGIGTLHIIHAVRSRGASHFLKALPRATAVAAGEKAALCKAKKVAMERNVAEEVAKTTEKAAELDAESEEKAAYTAPGNATPEFRVFVVALASLFRHIAAVAAIVAVAAFYCIPQSGRCLFCSGEVVVGLALLFRAAFIETGLCLVAVASYFTPLFSSLFALSDFVAVVTSRFVAVVTGIGLFLAAAIASKPRKRSKTWMRRMRRSSKPGARSKAWMRRCDDPGATRTRRSTGAE